MKELEDVRWNISVSGTAAGIVLKPASANVCDLILSGISTSGDVTYTVTCTADGKTYEKKGKLHVAGQDEERPVAKLAKNSYAANPGDQIVIDRRLYSNKNGNLLQGTAEWDPTDLLSAIGYERKQSDSAWTVTFYKEGNYDLNVVGYAGNLKVDLPIKVTIGENPETVYTKVLVLPKTLKTIEELAFSGMDAEVVDMRDTKVTKIGAKAFANCKNLKAVYLPKTVKKIAADAFKGSPDVVLYCNGNSWAKSWAKKHGIPTGK